MMDPPWQSPHAMGRVNQSPNRGPVAPQNGGLSLQKNFNENKNIHTYSKDTRQTAI